MLKRINAFVAIAEERSFTAAARRLNVAQPWLSVQLRQLEDSLGFALLKRDKRNVEVTAEGSELLDLAQRLSTDFAEFHKTADRVRRRTMASLTIYCERSTIHDATRSLIIAEYTRRNPDVQLRIVNASADEIYEALETELADLAYIPLPEPDPRMESLRASTHEIVLLVPEAHPFFTRTVVSNRDLAGETILTGNRRFTKALFDRHGGFPAGIEWVEPPEVEYESRWHMVQLTGRPSLWIDYPEKPLHLPGDVRIRRLAKPVHRDFGFVRMNANGSRIAKRFLDQARANQAEPHAAV